MVTVTYFRITCGSRDLFSYFPADIYLFKGNNRNIRKKCEICPKLIDVVLAFLLLTLNIFHTIF